MIRILIYIAILFALAFAGAWVADRPGVVTIDWLGYRIEVAVMVALVALAAVIVVIMLVWAILRSVIGTPALFGGFWRRRRENRGREALSRGLIAVGAGNVRQARRMAKDAAKFLTDEPATMLLQAQTAQLEGDTEEARNAFETMAERPDTKLLGLRGLHMEALRAGDGAAARHFAEAAHNQAPDLPWAATAVFDGRCAAQDWDGALTTLDALKRFKLVDKEAAKRRRAVLLTGQAVDLEDGEPERARRLAEEAHRLAPGLVPAAVIAGRVSSRLGDIRRATKVLEAAWKTTPHPEIADAYAHVRAGDSARDRMKRIRNLITLRANHEEGTLALAKAAIDVRDWDLARQTLTPLVKSGASQRGCLLMADIEEGEHGDRGRVREWLSRAVHAARDPVWTADGVVADAWAPVSPVTGRLDAFEWKVPATPLTPIEAMPVDEGLLHSLPEEPAEQDDMPAVVEVLPAPVALTPDRVEDEKAASAGEPDEEKPAQNAAASETEGDGAAHADTVPTPDSEPDMPVDAAPAAEETNVAETEPKEDETATAADNGAGNGAAAESEAGESEAGEDDRAADEDGETAKDAEAVSADAPAASDGDQPAVVEEAAEEAKAEDGAPTPVKFPLERPPDDPGPDGTADESERRFKLF